MTLQNIIQYYQDHILSSSIDNQENNIDGSFPYCKYVLEEFNNFFLK